MLEVSRGAQLRRVRGELQPLVSDGMLTAEGRETTTLPSLALPCRVIGRVATREIGNSSCEGVHMFVIN